VSGRPQVAQFSAVSLCAFAVPRPTLMSSMSEKAASGHQYLVQMAQFSIDICRIRDRTAHFCSQGFTESLAETRKPGTQSRDWHSESGCGFLLTGRLGAAAGHERP